MEGNFGPVVTAMVTPFTDDLKVDYKALEKIVEHLIATGSSALVVSGTTGESPTLEDDEKEELLRKTITLVKGRAKVIMGTGYNSTDKSIKASKQAESLGADALLVVAPYYNKPSQAGLLAHFEAVAGSVKLPIVVYNIPGRTGVNIASETMIEMHKRSGNIVALKDSTGSTDQSAEIAAREIKSLTLYSGDDYLTLPFLSIGAIGVISVASHIIGAPIGEMIRCYEQGNFARAQQIHGRYLPLFKGLFTAPNPTCVKYVLSVMGLCKAHMRLPLVPIDDASKQNLNKLLVELNLSAAGIK